ncbi:hypothetical protein BBK82_05100 [Lentzea guizhouensis]|uniref:Secreted protein n=1 Tax=Lentzea guizhouensis TaxID=1586287 RepID=A0A1B2HCV3_9PSEU|nr:hypothetical protein [Lentzea guizhouensis]ANZ35550.1 hypothetical protein BBK82_05100 [Lentzea guizhouensis]
MHRKTITRRLHAVALVAAAVAALTTACDLPPTCYGTEPHGEVEQLSPCPPGWAPGENRPITEDEFEDLEWSD